MTSRIIPNFPEPHEREFFYNIIARAMDQINSLSDRDKHYYFFGNYSKPGFYIEPNAANLCSRLGDIITPEQIIQEHSVFPFYNLFLTKERQESFKEKVLTLKTDRKGNRFNLKVLKELDLHAPRYCPTCLAKLKREGKPLFPRVEWQLPGIDVCPFDNTYLKDYPLLEGEDIREHYLMLEEDRLSFEGISCEDPDLINIAHMALELFDYPMFAYNQEELQRKLSVALREKGYFKDMNLDYQKLYYDLREYYRNRLQEKLPELEPINMFNHSFKNTWIGIILVSSKHMCTPVHWLIILNFLGLDLKEFLNIKVTSENYFFPATNQKVYCLNPVCSNYHLSRSILVSTALDSLTGRIRRIYRCSKCHMVYSTLDYEFEDIIQSGEILASYLQGNYLPILNDDMQDFINDHRDRIITFQKQKDNVSFDKKIQESRQKVYHWFIHHFKNIYDVKKQSFYKNLKKQCPNEYQFLLENDQNRFIYVLGLIMKLDNEELSLDTLVWINKALLRYAQCN